MQLSCSGCKVIKNTGLGFVWVTASFPNASVIYDPETEQKKKKEKNKQKQKQTIHCLCSSHNSCCFHCWCEEQLGKVVSKSPFLKEKKTSVSVRKGPFP